MARLYSNENLPLPVVEALRQFGHEVVTAQETGQANQALSDEAVLDFARAKRWALVTLNRKHFIRLHHERPNHFGIVVCSYDPDFSGLARRIHGAL